MAPDRTGSLEGLRESNRGRIVDALRTAGVASRADLARATGLSRTTVSTLVGDLVREGLVAEHADRVTPGNGGGRPPVMVSLDRRAGAAVGVDFGKSHVTVALADLGHEVLAERRRALPTDHLAATGLDAAADLLDELLAETGIPQSSLIGVGMGLAGPIHRTTGEVGSSAILPGWVGVRAAEALADRFDLPARVDNDANLGALAESTWGAARDAGDVVYLKLATGIGAGYVFDGRPYAGAGGTAGEIGHTVIDEHGPVCRCANRGCLETLASGAAAISLLKPTMGPDFSLPDLVRHVREGHPACTRVVADAGRHLGSAIGNLVNLLNPRMVVVGGELAACGDVLLEPLRTECRRHAIASAGDGVEVVVSPLGERAQVLGALALVLLEAANFSTRPEPSHNGPVPTAS